MWLTLMLEMKTGDSKKEVGLRPGGIVMSVDLEIGSLAGDISLYLAPPPPLPPPPLDESCLAVGSTGNSFRSLLTWGFIMKRKKEARLWRIDSFFFCYFSLKACVSEDFVRK